MTNWSSREDQLVLTLAREEVKSLIRRSAAVTYVGDSSIFKLHYLELQWADCHHTYGTVASHEL